LPFIQGFKGFVLRKDWRMTGCLVFGFAVVRRENSPVEFELIKKLAK